MIKKIQKLIFLSLLALSVTALANDIDDNERLRQLYQAPHELARLLDQAYEDNKDFRKCIDGYYHLCKCPNDMACYIKKEYVMKRIKNWDKGQQIINDKNLSEILLPQKYLWRNYLIAEKLQPDGNTLDGITKEQLAQIIVFAKKVKFGDFVGGKFLGTNNVFFTKDHAGKQFWKQNVSLIEDHEKKIAIIDTKYFYKKYDIPQSHNLWRLFSKNKIESCSYYTMVKSGDLNEFSRPNDFESFWQKYKECFQASKPDQD